MLRDAHAPPRGYIYIWMSSTILALCAVLVIPLAAEDWPQLLGPARNGVYTGSDLAESWPAGGPAVVWKQDIGQGFAAPVVAQGRLILFHRRANREIVESLDAQTGRRIWSFDHPTSYRDDFGFDPGPRAAPVISGGRVYTFGAEGMLHALDFASGRKLWSVAVREKFGAAKGFFGAGAGPLAEGGKLLVTAGGPNGAGIAAFDQETGKVLWTATSDEAGYSAPAAATIGGARHALFLTRAGFVDLDPATGKVRYRMRWRSRNEASVNAATPLVIGDMVFLSASYGTGATVLQFADGKWKQLWASDEVLSNHYATSVCHDGYLYGYHGRQEYGPSLRAVELKTGKVAWSVEDFGAGTLMLAGGRLLVLRESGELLSAPATPKGFQPSAKATLLKATVRAYPALAEGLLYVRNETTLACFSLRK
jgi:outer membrane protein assembly factor BamB